MDKQKAVAFTRCDNGRDALEDVTPTMRCGSNHSAHLAAAIPINGMTLNKELRDKQMTGVGQEGDPMFSVRSNGAQHAIAFNCNARADELPSVRRNTALNDGLTARQRAAVAQGGVWPSVA